MIPDLNTDFQINPDSDLDTCRIAPKMLWICYPVGISHFVRVSLKLAGDWMRSANKSSKIANSAVVRVVEK